MSITNKAFTPPAFGSFGKKSKDLFKKKYDFDNQAKLVSSTVDGLVIETAVVAATESPLRGVFKTTAPVKTLGVVSGVFESEFHTDASRESSTAYKFNCLARGLSLKAKLVSVRPEVKGETPDFAEGFGQVEAEYAQEFVSATVGVRSNVAKSLVDGSIAFGFDRLSVGAKVVVDTASAVAPTDFNFGVQFEGADFVVAAATEKKRTSIAVNYFQVVGRGHTVGAMATFGLVKPSRTLTVGTDYVIDVDTTARAFVKVDSNSDSTVIGTNIEHRMLNPNVLIAVSAEFNASAASAGVTKFGCSLTFGDY